MRVNNAVHVLNPQVATALEYLANENPKDERITTAWFIDFIHEWYDCMTRRDVFCALSLRDKEKYEQTRTFLSNAMYIFEHMQIGAKGIWKPFQTSALLSTKTLLDLSEYLLKERNFDFFLSSRLSQDCIENLFSEIRLKQVIPNAVQFKNNLKLIIMSRYMKNIKSSNYTQDDRKLVADFFAILLKSKKSKRLKAAAAKKNKE